MQITGYHIELYKKVGGDVDHLQRIGNIQEKNNENQNIIAEIVEIVASLELINNGVASIQFTDAINSRLLEVCADTSVIQELKKLVTLNDQSK